MRTTNCALNPCTPGTHCLNPLLFFFNWCRAEDWATCGAFFVDPQRGAVWCAFDRVVQCVECSHFGKLKVCLNTKLNKSVCGIFAGRRLWLYGRGYPGGLRLFPRG